MNYRRRHSKHHPSTQTCDRMCKPHKVWPSKKNPWMLDMKYSDAKRAARAAA